MANGKALSIDEAENFVKIIIDSTTDEILGAQIAGPNAKYLITEIAVLVQNRCRGASLLIQVTLIRPCRRQAGKLLKAPMKDL